MYRHCPVLLNQLEPKCNRIYYERLPDYKERALRWQDFEILAKKLGLPPTSKDTMRELTLAQSSALHELWDEAGKVLIEAIELGKIEGCKNTPYHYPTAWKLD